MNFLSLILGLIAVVLFLLAAFWEPAPANPPRRPVSLLALGLAFSIACFMAQLLIQVADPILISKP